MSQKLNKSVVFFDGNCGLCDRSVQFLIRNDAFNRFLYCPLQSPYAEKLIGNHQLPDSVLLYKNNQLYYESAAVFEILKDLKFYWRLLLIFQLLPSTITNYFYRLIAANRKKWYGTPETCTLPSDLDSTRFVSSLIEDSSKDVTQI